MLTADKLAISAARLLLRSKRRVPLEDLRWLAVRALEERRLQHPELERFPKPAQVAVWESWHDELAQAVADRGAAL